MTILFAACSEQAYRLLEQIRKKWEEECPGDVIYSLVKCSMLPEVSIKESLVTSIGEWFTRVDAIVFLCAAGIAVRCIAPYLIHKAKDPAVVVMDESGHFCISLLSGHMGGANELAERVGRMAGAVPVITTASDRRGKMAVDLFARKNGLLLEDWNGAKRLEARILAGEKIGLAVDERLKTLLTGELPEEVLAGEGALKCSAGIDISVHREHALFPLTLRLVPQAVSLGIGCRKGTGAERIARAAEACLQAQDICREAVFTAASIDMKKDEAGILEFCERNALPFITFSAKELQEQPGTFTASAFVSEVTGVDNVCERSAVAAAHSGALLCRKFVMDGVTVALAAREISIEF